MAKKSLFLTLAVGIALLVSAPSLTASDTYIRIVQITYVGGDVEVARTADGTPSPASEYQPLDHDSLILTEDGVAEIEFENEITARLAEDTRLHLAELLHRDDGSRYTRLTLRSGTATFLARLRGDDEFMVTTAYFTVLSGSKARFRIDLTESGGRVQVFKGRVEVETPSETLQLSKGRQLEWDASNGQAALAELSEPDGWDEWNADRDDVVEAARRRQRWSNLAGAVGYYGDPHYGHYHRWGYCPYYYGSYAYGHYPHYYYSSWGLFSFGHYAFYPIYYGHHYPTFIISFGHSGRRHHRARRHRRGHHRARHDGDGHHDATTDSSADGDHDDATIARDTTSPRRRGASRVDRSRRTDFRRNRRSGSNRARSRRSSDSTGNWVPVSTVGTRRGKPRKADSSSDRPVTRRRNGDSTRTVSADEKGKTGRTTVSRRERPRSRTNMARLSRTSARNTAATARRSSSTTRSTTRRSQARSRPATTRISDRSSRESNGSKPKASRSGSNSRSSARASSGRRTSAKRTSARRGKAAKRSSGGRRSSGGKSKSRSSGGGGRSKSKKSS